MKTLSVLVKLEHPVSDEFNLTLEETDEFHHATNIVLDFLNHELEVINSKFRLTKQGEVND